MRIDLSATNEVETELINDVLSEVGVIIDIEGDLEWIDEDDQSPFNLYLRIKEKGVKE